MLKPIFIGIYTILLSSTPAWAVNHLPQHFQHQDWEVACSNTGTCRAAGYNSDDDYQSPASILLTRQAGPQQAIIAEVALSRLEDEENPVKNTTDIQFYLNGVSHGKVKIGQRDLPLMARLNSAQTQALIKFANQNVKIEFKSKDHQWQVSDKGMTSVLLKMDDLQKRIGTTGALTKKGNKSEKDVLQAQSMRTVKAIKTATKPSKVVRQTDQAFSALQRRLLSHTTADTECMSAKDINDNFKDENIEIYSLNQQKVVATTLCWQGAYNRGYGFWLMDKDLKSNIEMITDAGSEFTAGIIDSAQKGRGIGDCWSVAQWVWNGQRFIQSIDRTTGMCKGFMGGIWDLDLIESKVLK